MNNNKIPCGGFRIGDGLTMDGDTLKSLGGAYVKVSTNDGETFEFMDDSPLKTFEEIRQKAITSVVTLLLYTPGAGTTTLYFNFFSDLTIGFYSMRVAESNLNVVKISIDSNNKITLSRSEYTLTPAT